MKFAEIEENNTLQQLLKLKREKLPTSYIQVIAIHSEYVFLLFHKNNFGHLNSAYKVYRR